MPKSPKQYLIEDQVIVDKIYPLVQATVSKRTTSLKSCIERFIHKRHDVLYDYAPVDRIYFKKSDSDDFFNSINLKEKEITSILPELYYWKAEELQACKDEFSLSCLMALRYMLKERAKDKSLTELVLIYLAFSGKFYAACHYKCWNQFTPNREVMDYVVNYMLSQKFDLIKYKSVWGAVRSLSLTWLDKYKEELISDDITDERIVYLIHQLHNRILAFLKNISTNYYEAYKKKLYMNAESDNFDGESGYRIANNNSTIVSGITEKTMIYVANTQVNLTVCYNVSGTGVDPYDIKSIFETIINSNEKLDDLRFVINVMLVDFCNHFPDEKDITGPKFIAYSITMKPNSKDKNILQMKNIIIGWLNTSDRYKSIKTVATKNNYYKAILSYIAIIVNMANKEK